MIYHNKKYKNQRYRTDKSVQKELQSQHRVPQLSTNTQTTQRPHHPLKLDLAAYPHQGTARKNHLKTQSLCILYFPIPNLNLKSDRPQISKHPSRRLWLAATVRTSKESRMITIEGFEFERWWVNLCRRGERWHVNDYVNFFFLVWRSVTYWLMNMTGGLPPLDLTGLFFKILMFSLYYGSQWVWILPQSLDFIFHISFSCAINPDFYGISLNSTHVYIYIILLMNTKSKSSRKDNDQTVILM